MKPILIHKSDSTIFANVNKFLTFNLETELDLTGWQAKFILGWVEKTIDDISLKSFEIILDSQDTKQLRLGKQYGTIILTDSNGNIKTVTNTIPFEVTIAVIENEYQEIDLTIPESSGVDIKLKVGASTVTSVNGMTGDVNLTAQDVGALPVDTYIPSIDGLATEEQLQQGLNTKQDLGDYATNSRVNEVEELIPDITPLATKQELTQGLNTKQNKGNYALAENVPTQVSQLENDSNFATQTQVMQAIASIPQFSISLVESLPETGEKMTLYLVSKGGESPDVYDEYIWIEQTSSFEFLGTTAVDLTGYVKNTDYASSKEGGIIKIDSSFGTQITSAGYMYAYTENLTKYTQRNGNFVIGKGTLENIKNDLVKRAVTENDIELTADEQTNARTWLNAVGKEDYATKEKGGIIAIHTPYGTDISSSGGLLRGISYTKEQYATLSILAFISKGTLDNVLTQYKKCSDPITQAEYEALETKDANTLYLIEE